MSRRRKRRRRSRSGGGGGGNLDELTQRLSDYTPIQPEERIRLETTPDETTGRLMDIIAPIGKGQRMLITSPPKAGKTMVLQNIARAVHKNYPDIYQLALLVDERPEEATDFRRNLPIKVEASTTDKTPKEHIRVAEKVFTKALERLLDGDDVLILLDSLTRLARAYNTTYGSSGRTLSGGVTAGALDRPRQLFGAARNFEEGGSLTIVATALIDTGSRMDEVIFQEFKGTGNAEVILDRKLAQKRLWPAINVNESGTRRENLLYDDIEKQKIPALRRKLASMGETEGLEWLLGQFNRNDLNEQVIKQINF